VSSGKKKGEWDHLKRAEEEKGFCGERESREGEAEPDHLYFFDSISSQEKLVGGKRQQVRAIWKRRKKNAQVDNKREIERRPSLDT